MTRSDKLPWLIAHRGARDEAPDNTVSAFEAAWAYPIDGIELDVQLTSDGTLVLFHDITLAKIGGGRRRVSDLTADELWQLDWSSAGREFRGELVPTLAEVIEEYAEDTRLLVEIKAHAHDRKAGRVPELTRRVMDLLREEVPLESVKNTFVLSFDRDVLEQAHKIDRNWNLVLNTNDPSGIIDVDPHIHAYDAPIRKITKEFVDRMHAHGKRVMTWSCNNAAQVRRALDAGVDAMITDKPGWLVEHLGIEESR